MQSGVVNVDRSIDHHPCGSRHHRAAALATTPQPQATHTTPNPSQTPPEPPASRASSCGQQPRMTAPPPNPDAESQPKKRMGSALGQLLSRAKQGLLAAAAASRAGRSIICHRRPGAAAALCLRSRRAKLGYRRPPRVWQRGSIDRSHLDRSTGATGRRLWPRKGMARFPFSRSPLGLGRHHI